MNRNNNFLSFVYILFFLYMVAIIATILGYVVANTNHTITDDSDSIVSESSVIIDTTTITELETTTTESETITTRALSTDMKSTFESRTKETTDSTILPERTTATVSTFSTISANQEISTSKTSVNQDFLSYDSKTSSSSTTTTTTAVYVESSNTDNNSNTRNGLTFVKTFNRGTYYCYGCNMKGGSGRQLISCYTGDGVVKGSIASYYLYANYGYMFNGRRTIVYLEIPKHPEMNGYYYLDDSSSPEGQYKNDVIDFFYIYSAECPFQLDGVVQVDCYIDLGA